MIFRRIYNEQLSQASYLVGAEATGEALVVDPNRDAERYLELAASQGLRVAAVTETHIHADFVSGARELAARAGAQLYLSDAGPAEWKYEYAREAGAGLLRDGDRFRVGELSVQASHTPGHTPEHLSFLLTDTASAPEPMGIFTGDFVFVGDVGRPDLLETAAGVAGAKEEGARQLYRALARFRELPDWLQVWPGHGAGSPCGRALGSAPQSTVGYEKRFNWAFGVRDEGEFVRGVLAGQPEPPAYFGRMKRVNKEGPAPLSSLPEPAQPPADGLPAEVERGTLVVDARSPEAFAAGHVLGSLNLPAGPGFLTWAGALLPYDRPLALIADAAQIQGLIAQLRLIGHDALAAYWDASVLESPAVGAVLRVGGRVDVQELRRLLGRGEVALLDVRGEGEHAGGRIPGSVNVPLARLGPRMHEVPAGRPLVVHCQGGLRSSIAASMLRARGREDVLDLAGGIAAWGAAGLPVEEGR